MSTYNVDGNGPLQAIPFGELAPVTVINTGSRAVYLSETLGIYSYGFQLPPGGTKVWPANTPLALQCAPDNVTTVTVAENAGEYYAPTILNVPAVVWENDQAVCAQGSSPTGGKGDPYTGAGFGLTAQSFSTNVTNYNSLILTILESGPNGVAYEMRDVGITWSNKSRDGSIRVVYRQNFKYYTLNNVLGTPQLQIAFPPRGQYFSISLGPVTWATTPTTPNTIDVIVTGDSKVISRTIAKCLAYSQFQAEPVFLDADLSIDNHCSGSVSVPATSNMSFSFSHISGHVHAMFRVSTTTAVVQGTRIEIVDRYTNDVLMASEFNIGAQGALYSQMEGYLSPSPMKIVLYNAQAAAQTMYIALKWEEI